MTDRSPDLQAIREQIESVDRKILTHLKERMALVESVAMSKIENAFPFRDKLREEQLLLRIRKMAAELDLDAHEVERLYRLIMEMAISQWEMNP